MNIWTSDENVMKRVDDVVLCTSGEAEDVISRMDELIKRKRQIGSFQRWLKSAKKYDILKAKLRKGRCRKWEI
jgi:hypothetical protein